VRELGVGLALAAGAVGCIERGPATGPGERREAAAGDAALAAVVRTAARPLTGGETDHDALLAMARGADVVLLGEQTHGTHEFYRERTRITQRLVAEGGFRAVTIEGDWPDAWRVNAYVRGLGTDRSAEEALSSFTRFPEWMWRNAEVRDLVRWLREHNAGRPAAEQVGFYGLDVYGLGGSLTAVQRWVDANAPEAAARVRAHYACFAPSGGDAQRYGAAAARGSSCETAALSVIGELERVSTSTSDPAVMEARFGAVRAAHSVASAEAYFRTAHTGGGSTWNLRDTRMAETLEAVRAHVATSTGAPGRAVVWAHNTHVGDARHTEMGAGGEINLGQLMRERHGDRAVLVGFLTYAGTVLAAEEWDAPGRVRTVRPALPESFAAVFHDAATAAGVRDLVLPLRSAPAAAEALAASRLERAIGVVYRPDTERQSHYFTSRLGRRFDYVIHLDQTKAVTPIR
jgi:erythromycin esterase-like protein